MSYIGQVAYIANRDDALLISNDVSSYRCIQLFVQKSWYVLKRVGYSYIGSIHIGLQASSNHTTLYGCNKHISYMITIATMYNIVQVIHSCNICSYRYKYFIYLFVFQYCSQLATTSKNEDYVQIMIVHYSQLYIWLD